MTTKIITSVNRLTKAVGAKFEGDLGQCDKLWLRKEIIRNLFAS